MPQRHGRFFELRVLAGCAALGCALGAVSGPARAACRSAEPESILVCLQRAYASRDSAAYAELLSDDFLLYNYGPDSTAWDCAIARQAASDLFKRVASLRLDFLGWKVRPGAAARTWVLDSLDAKVTLIPTRAPHSQAPIEMLSSDNTLYLRGLPAPDERIVIYRWERPRPAKTQAN